MSHLYGRLQGMTREVTRCGSKNSGLTATLESWQEKLRLDLDGDGFWVLERMRKDDHTGEIIVKGRIVAD